MPRMTWTLELDQRRPTVTLDYDVWSGSRVLTVDGVRVTCHGKVLTLWWEQTFAIGASRFMLTTRPVRWRPWTLVVELHNAGRVIRPTSVTR
jgi:hypothetical protein